MQQRPHHQGHAKGREHSALCTAPTALHHSAEPGHALHNRNNTHGSRKVDHHRHATAKRLLALAVGSAVVLLPVLAVADARAGATSLTIGFAALLGAIQGATEFLPVSSSGHLSLGQAWLGIDPESAGHRFNITLHAGTLLAVIWVYRSEVLALLRVLIRPTQATPDRQRLLMMLLASLPLGIALIPAVEHAIVALESEVRWVGIALWVTAAILFVAFRGQKPGKSETVSELPPTPKQALLIGLAQVVAIIPGISRSGSTIAAGLAVGLDRDRAARFSFLISLIAVGGASAKELLGALTTAPAGAIDPLTFVVGFATSLVVGLLSLRGLLYLVGQGRVTGFVIYLVLMGGIAVTVGP